MIVINGLSKSFGPPSSRVLALDEVSLRVGTARICGVLGDAGAGKSTLAACVAGYDTPEAGVVRIGGTDLALTESSRRSAAAQQVTVMPGDATLVRGRTVAGNAATPLELAGVERSQRRRRVGEVLDLAGLTELAGRGVAELTDGQRARLNLARGLVTGPAVLVADEPAGAGGHASSVYVALDRARSELGITVLLLTRDVIGLRAACDEVAILEAGRVLESGNMFSLAADPASLTSAAVLPRIEAEPDGPGHDRIAEMVLVGAASVDTTIPEARRRFGVRIDVLGLQRAQLGETPIAWYFLGLSGVRAGAALGWLSARGRLRRRDVAAAADHGACVVA
jgi:D-methionine transport system ATP-binding protein